MMPPVIVKLLATLAILCQLAPLGGGAGLPGGADPGSGGPISPSVACGDSSLPEGAGEEMTEREMLACGIYCEAGGDECSDDTRRKVGDVMLNRVEDERFPSTLEAVLTAPLQYGRFSVTGIIWPERANNPGEAHAVERAYRIADELLAGEHSELYGQGYVWQAEFEQGTEGF